MRLEGVRWCKLGRQWGWRWERDLWEVGEAFGVGEGLVGGGGGGGGIGGGGGRGGGGGVAEVVVVGGGD